MRRGGERRGRGLVAGAVLVDEQFRHPRTPVSVVRPHVNPVAAAVLLLTGPHRRKGAFVIGGHYDHVGKEGQWNRASRRGVRVCNVQGYASHSVSDHALALILAFLNLFACTT